MCIAWMKEAAEFNQVVAQIQRNLLRKAAKLYPSYEFINIICTICKIKQREKFFFN